MKEIIDKCRTQKLDLYKSHIHTILILHLTDAINNNIMVIIWNSSNKAIFELELTEKK